MKRRLALFLYSYAIAIETAWDGGTNRFVLTNRLIALFLLLNTYTLFLCITKKDLQHTIVADIAALTIWGIYYLILSRVFKISYMAHLKFEKNQLLKGRIYLFAYFIASCILLIIAKENIP